MHTSYLPRISWPIIGLLLLMAATRFHHQGTAFALPDASLAVFFLGGWYLRDTRVFVGYLLAAFAIDYLAIAHMGVSDYCISPAYGFLIPTYAALWYAGRWAKSCCNPVKTSLALWAATTVAFVVSNGSFFLFSGRLGGADGMAYSLGVLQDYPGYLFHTALYCAVVFGGALLVRSIPNLKLGDIK